MRWTYILAAVLSLGLASAAMAAGSTSSSTKPAKTGNFEKGVAAVEGKDYHRAIFLLYKAVEQDADNADAQNWLGYSNRKIGDFENAFKFYKMALATNPEHKGAHEYIGEAYLEAGNPTMAEQHLSALNKLCPNDCEEYNDLKAAIEAYKSDKVSG